MPRCRVRNRLFQRSPGHVRPRCLGQCFCLKLIVNFNQGPGDCLVSDQFYTAVRRNAADLARRFTGIVSEAEHVAAQPNRSRGLLRRSNSTAEQRYRAGQLPGQRFHGRQQSGRQSIAVHGQHQWRIERGAAFHHAPRNRERSDPDDGKTVFKFGCMLVQFGETHYRHESSLLFCEQGKGQLFNHIKRAAVPAEASNRNSRCRAALFRLHRRR